MSCAQLSTQLGYIQPLTGPRVPVTIHYEYRLNAAGVVEMHAVRYTNAAGVIVTVPAGATVIPGPLPPGAEYDKTILCDPATGNKVLVIVTYDAVGVPTTAVYNLNGTPFTGTVALLEQCSDGGGFESDAITMCDGGTTFLRWVVKGPDGAPTGVVFNTTLAGAVYAPIGVPTFGACQLATGPVNVFTAMLPGTQAFLSDFNLPQVLAYTVKQIDGVGTITGDTGAPVPMFAGETWSASAGDGTFSLSQNTSFNAGSGEMRLLITYR